jgi:hypothetical protein
VQIVMISTREETELMFRKWMDDSSTIFFTALHPDRTILNSFNGNVVGIAENRVLFMGEGDSAEVDLWDAQFSFITSRDVPSEVHLNAGSRFETGIVIREANGSMYAFFEIGEK